MQKIETVFPDHDGKITVSLGDHIEGGGVVKCDLPDEAGRQEKHGYQVVYQILAQVHGAWESAGHQGASLMVLKVIPIIDDHEHWFKHLEIRLTFDKTQDSDPSDPDPTIASFQPAQEGKLAVDQVPYSIEKADTDGVSLEVKAPGDMISGTYTTATSTTTRFEARKQHTIQAYTERKSHKSTSKSVVVWKVIPIDQSRGVGDSITIAALIKRPKGSEFAIIADTIGTIGKVYDALNKFKRRSIVRIEPLGTVQKMLEGSDVHVDDNDLHALSRGKSTSLSDIVQKSGIHVAEIVEPLSYRGSKLPFVVCIILVLFPSFVPHPFSFLFPYSYKLTNYCSKLCSTG